jgi:hypothetical protein
MFTGLVLMVTRAELNGRAFGGAGRWYGRRAAPSGVGTTLCRMRGLGAARRFESAGIWREPRVVSRQRTGPATRFKGRRPLHESGAARQPSPRESCSGRTRTENLGRDTAAADRAPPDAQASLTTRRSRAPRSLRNAAISCSFPNATNRYRSLMSFDSMLFLSPRTCHQSRVEP